MNELLSFTPAQVTDMNGIREIQAVTIRSSLGTICSKATIQ